MKAIDQPFVKIVNGTTQFVIPIDHRWIEAFEAVVEVLVVLQDAGRGLCREFLLRYERVERLLVSSAEHQLGNPVTVFLEVP